MIENRPTDTMEMYKLHAELADRVSQRRVETNRIFAGVLMGTALGFATLLRISGGSSHDGPVFSAVGFGGLLLALSWFFLIRSYQQLNTGKFRALMELEEKLPYQFFEREWCFLGGGEDAKKYMRLSRVEQIVPWLFCALYGVVFACGIYALVT